MQPKPIQVGRLRHWWYNLKSIGQISVQTTYMTDRWLPHLVVVVPLLQLLGSIAFGLTELIPRTVPARLRRLSL